MQPVPQTVEEADSILHQKAGAAAAAAADEMAVQMEVDVERQRMRKVEADFPEKKAEACCTEVQWTEVRRSELWAEEDRA